MRKKHGDELLISGASIIQLVNYVVM